MTLTPDVNFPMREPCQQCGEQRGRLDRRGVQDCVFCATCGKFSYNAPRSETGKPVVHLGTRHNVSPSQRNRILARDSHRCVLCGANGESTGLHIGHLISVHESGELGLSDRELQSDENLATFCATCNLGLGKNSVSARLIAALVHRRSQTAPSPRRSDEDLFE
jgi:5-methylcytosine-specific restriction endonuclease McrA